MQNVCSPTISVWVTYHTAYVIETLYLFCAILCVCWHSYVSPCNQHLERCLVYLLLDHVHWTTCYLLFFPFEQELFYHWSEPCLFPIRSYELWLWSLWSVHVLPASVWASSMLSFLLQLKKHASRWTTINWLCVNVMDWDPVQGVFLPLFHCSQDLPWPWPGKSSYWKFMNVFWYSWILEAHYHQCQNQGVSFKSFEPLICVFFLGRYTFKTKLGPNWPSLSPLSIGKHTGTLFLNPGKDIFSNAITFRLRDYVKYSVTMTLHYMIFHYCSII